MATYSVDETEPLLSALHRTSGSLTFNSPSHTPESEGAQPRALTSKFSLCLALLVDAIPGNHLSNEFLDKKTLKKIKKSSYLVVFTSKFDPGCFGPHRSEAWP